MRFPFLAVCKEPPYKVEESGYAGFIMPIEVHFRNKVGARGRGLAPGGLSGVSSASWRGQARDGPGP